MRLQYWRGVVRQSKIDCYCLQFIVYKEKLHLTWCEQDPNKFQIRVAVYNGNDSSPLWDFVDGDGTTGLNLTPLQDANKPNLLPFENKLYAIWTEFHSGSSADKVLVTVANQ